MNDKVWVWWDGPCPPLYELCWQTIARHNETAWRIGPAELVELGGESVLQETAGLSHAIRSDLIRVWLAYTYGGIWLDADTVALRPIDWIRDVSRYDLIAVRNPNPKGIGARGCVATPWAARAGSPIAAKMLAAVRAAVQTMQGGKRVPYGQTSTGVLSRSMRANRDKIGGTGGTVLLHAHWRYCPIPWYRARAAYWRRGTRQQHERHTDWRPAVYTYHLTNPIKQAFDGQTAEQILAGDRFVSFLLSKSLGLSRALPPRSAEILRRVPLAEPQVGVEVGVFRGDNSVQLLQQRPFLTLLLVDPYRDMADPSYRATADFQARFNNARWDAVAAGTRKRLAFAGARAQFVRAPSLVAAAAVADQSVDWVWIDANHSAAAVAADIAAWAPKIRPGGWIGGHDYRHPHERRRRYGVTDAVDAWAAMRGLTVQSGADTTWFCRL
jgi:hypothetical protein